MMKEPGSHRRDFLKSAAAASSAAITPAATDSKQEIARRDQSTKDAQPAGKQVSYPRVFTGPALNMISFPLGGIGAGSLGLGGRGQLRDWEIFNRADQGNALTYAFPSIWAKVADEKSVAHVLESRIETPYQGQDGLGANNVPGLSRLQGATFTGEFPAAHIEFHDNRLPLQIALDAGTPFIPLDADASGLPLAALHYRVRNIGRRPVSVSIVFSLENPVKDRRAANTSDVAHRKQDSRVNEWRRASGIQGLAMTNPALPETAAEFGSFALVALDDGLGSITGLKGWPAGRWWNSPLLFWDDFSSDGALGPEANEASAIGAVCLNRSIAPGGEAKYSFLLAWHFPNRTPEHCGWQAPKGREQTVIGNWYATRFADAWAVAEYAATHLPELEARTTVFLDAMRHSTLPPCVKEAAMSNLSTLVSTTCFRTADGDFHGFEGVHDKGGCCFGNCTHVWNYETATAHLFPQLSRSLRRSAFGYSMDERGAMYFRQLLPDGLERSGFAAADGQMGQIIKVYLDWQLSGDQDFLREFWPKTKRALEFAWIPGGWDANRDGVMEGVQHNTYDVEFYGPNPLCTIYYLGALRAAEEMARAAGDLMSAAEYQRLFVSGRNWIDGNLFNGEYYVQRIEGRPAESIAAGLRSGMGADDPRQPQYQAGDGCLVDQLLGQYLADVCGLGELVDRQHLQRTLDAIYRYNHKANLYNHETVQRTFALNDEAALIICDYGKGKRPRIPFPYYAEVMTGFEYSAASLMLFRGMVAQGVECINDIRSRYDGVRRNPWDEAECGHHYARAMASWSGIVALSGFHYRGSTQSVTAIPRTQQSPFRSFWSTGTGWGLFSISNGSGRTEFALSTVEGSLSVKELALAAASTGKSEALLNQHPVAHSIQVRDGRALIRFNETVSIGAQLKLSIKI